MAKLTAIIKRPDEQYGHMTYVSARLENLQKIVEGNIETVKLTDHDIILCNESGKILDLPKNLRMFGDTIYSDTLRGTIIVIGTDDEEFDHVEMNFQTWKKLVDKWEGR